MSKDQQKTIKSVGNAREKSNEVKGSSKSIDTKSIKSKSSTTKISRLLRHILAYAIALFIIVVLGYLYYATYLVNKQLVLQSAKHSQQIEELQEKQSSDLSGLTQQYQNLEDTATKDTEQIAQIKESTELLAKQIPLIQQQIKSQELWQMQVSQLLFLAEQERMLGNRPASINYLLQQVEQLVVASKAATAAQLQRLLVQDIASYEKLSNVDVSEIYRDINNLESIITKDLQFKSSFYDEITEEEARSSWEEYNIPVFLQRFTSSIGKYIRISHNEEPSQILTQDKRDLTMSSIVLMLNQAKNALIKGDEVLYYTILEDLKEEVIKFFAEGLDRNRAIDLQDQLIAEDILPGDLPPLQSYEFFFRP